MTTQAFIDTVLKSTAYDKTGEKVGSVDQLFLDERTGEPTFVTINTGLFGLGSSIAPLNGARLDGEDLHLAYEKDLITKAPDIKDPNEGLTPEQENKLYAHYGLVAADPATTEQHAAPATANTAANDDAIVRSEEQLNVHKDTVAASKVRLKKYVVTETKTVEVPVTREEVRIEREPISAEEAARLGDGTIGEDETEVVLHEEQVHVSKEAVPVERINLSKEAVTETETVSEDLRKERIDIDQDDAHRS